MKRTLIKAVILAFVFALMGGCVTTEQLAQVRAIAESAQSTADSATATADNASATADNALTAANQAADAARSAQSAADAATACCGENSSKLDRMFEKAMQK